MSGLDPIRWLLVAACWDCACRQTHAPGVQLAFEAIAQAGGVETASELWELWNRPTVAPVSVEKLIALAAG